MKADVHGIPVLESISPFARRYDAWLADIWGVMHNGLKPFPSAVEACRLFRDGGGTVVLISNAPRPRETVVEQLRIVGVPDDCYDGIVTSGDVTCQLLRGYGDGIVYHIGPERDLPTFHDLGVQLGGPSEAAVAVCTGLIDDETETPDDYAALLGEMRGIDLPMICANPDIMVERGPRLVYCAGALAEAYGKLGGEVIYAGKPHAPIYDLAFGMVADKRGHALPRHRIVAIGDGIRTDIAGAAAQDIDSVFVASGVHMGDSARTSLNCATLSRLFAGNSARPVAALAELAW
jgi:HAD superfamily hydrolase (TIGR01459 family)